MLRALPVSQPDRLALFGGGRSGGIFDDFPRGVALALFLMIGAGLFVRTLRKLGETSAGFDQDRVAILRLDHDPSSFKGLALRGLFRRIEERLHMLRGVEAVSFFSMLNFGQSAWSEHVWPEGKAHPRQCQALRG